MYLTLLMPDSKWLYLPQKYYHTALGQPCMHTFVGRDKTIQSCLMGWYGYSHEFGFKGT